jgi:endonuclease/exonuclease/phosphatase (EEP) superfamily protein YafD
MGSILARYAIAGSWVYYTLLFLWALGYFVTGDRYPLFVILNAVALYLFLPVPLAAVVAIVTRRRVLLAAAATGVMLFAVLWGWLVVPRGRAVREGEPTLTVMTYNVNGSNENVDAIVAVIESVDADIVLLQEVNERLADTLGEDLGERYPYQVLDPYNDVRGMGMISKLPLRSTGESLPLQWVGTPQILAVEWAGKRVRLVNFHIWAFGLGPGRMIEINARAREAHALYLIDFVLIAERDGPVIVAGDANATPQSDAYRMLARWLQDSWTEAGYGLGHTIPGGNAPGSTWPQLGGIPVPRWLLRIDYVFHSVGLEAVEAFVTPFDGASDHRAVVVTFTLSE